ncbi:MAG TPA: hypothetical protein VE966_10655 [Gemmatimonadales bacterium]|nr:hypothetical protein [Gemmatimonadales bacterium]
MRSTARLEWFLGGALILLVAQLGFGVWAKSRIPRRGDPTGCGVVVIQLIR